jgi:hypothetical protein
MTKKMLIDDYKGYELEETEVLYYIFSVNLKEKRRKVEKTKGKFKKIKLNIRLLRVNGLKRSRILYSIL